MICSFFIPIDNWQISGGGKSGKLLVDDIGGWSSICYNSDDEFTNDLADAACKSIGYRRSSDVYPITLKCVLYISVIIVYMHIGWIYPDDHMSLFQDHVIYVCMYIPEFEMLFNITVTKFDDI